MTPITTIDARAVANYLLAKADVDQKTLGQLQLHKLTYLSHGWHLGLSDQPLIVQEVHAWPYGPVIPALYFEFKQFGDGPIGGRARYYDRLKGWQDFHPALGDYSKAVVDAVWQNYGNLTGSQLITLTHEPGTPWATVTAGRQPSQIRDIPISNDLIRQYYRGLAQKNQAKKESGGGT
jgi:uncharacterized phage-associated protein